MKIKTKISAAIILTTFIISIISALPVNATSSPNWDVTGGWTIRVYYGSGTYDHSYTLAMLPSGEFSGTGGYPAGLPYTITEVITGNVVGDVISWHSIYLTGNPGYTWDGTGTIASDGTISGTWSSNAGQSGDCESIDGAAEPSVLTLVFPPGSTALPTITILEEGDLPECIPPLPAGLIQTPYVNVEITGQFEGMVEVAFHYEDTGDDDFEEGFRLYMADCVDFNNDGTINGIDISIINKAIRDETTGDDPRYDVNNDGTVDASDVGIVKIYANSGLIVNQDLYGLEQARLPWIDITTWVDTENNIVYGETAWFSLFRCR